MSQRAASSVGSSSTALSTPKTSPMIPPAPELSWQTLIDNVLAFIDSHPRPYPYNRMEKPFVPTEYSSRVSPLEVCVCEVCPAFPDFMVIGTYALVGKGDRKEHYAQMHKGTLSIMTVAPKFKATYAGMLLPNLDKNDFSSAILDLHFHPNDDSLLCAATSAASIHFFRLVKQASILERRLDMKLLPLGWAKIAEDDEHGLTHLITQFTWLPEISTTGREGVNDQLIVALAATESSGRVQIVKLAIPAIRNVFDKRAEILENVEPEKLAFSQVYLRNHDQEAWTVATFDIPSPPGTNNRILLSGGDDSTLKTSLLNLCTPPATIPPTLDILASSAIDGWTDHKSYNGGVIAILPLTPTLVTTSIPSQLETTIPLLTGSYDDTIRLYTINPSTMQRRLILDLPLGGGVWRLKLMDEYDGTNKHHFIILASCMHAGARILRVAYDTSFNTGWTMEVIGRFEKGHDSMVYCCDFRREEGEGEYMVVSTSFYDKKICTWGFVDAVKRRMGEVRELKESGSWEVLGTQGSSLSSASTTGWVKEDGVWKMR
jgi:diphthine methyl ester acylhydrolase